MSTGPGGGLFGGGGFFGGGGPPVNYGPRGQFGVYPGCGCSGILMILAGVLMVMGGCARMFNF
jgi:hypothetical protein